MREGVRARVGHTFAQLTTLVLCSTAAHTWRAIKSSNWFFFVLYKKNGNKNDKKKRNRCEK